MSIENKFDKKENEEPHDKKPFENVPFSDIISHEINVETKRLRKHTANELKSRRHELENKLKIAQKHKKYYAMLEYLGELTSIELFFNNEKKAAYWKEKQNLVDIKIMQDRREILLEEIKGADIAGEYAKVEMLYRECRNISNKLFMFGLNEESEQSKHFSYLEAIAHSKAVFVKYQRQRLK